MSNNAKVPNRQVQRTCSWILEAVLLLMDEKPYDKITVSDITAKAGIARQTFYRNFNDKNEVVIKYFQDIFSSEILSVENINDKTRPDDILLTFNIKYMVKHKANLKKMLSSVGGIENLFLDMSNEWLDMLISQGKRKLNAHMQIVFRYKIHYQVTGILRLVMDWFKNDMPIPVDNLVEMLKIFTVDTKIKYKNVPNIKIKIIDS